MIKNSICILFVLFIASQIQSQVIYERTYPDAFPSIEFPVELSDASTFSMDNLDNICVRFGSRHIDAHGNEIKSNSISAEAFSSGYHWIGHDSVLVWYEQGSWDVGPDSFHILLWTPEAITKLHSRHAYYDIPPFRRYGAFLYSLEQIVFQISDTLYVKNLITQMIDDSIIISGISTVLEFKEGILVIRTNELPILINKDLDQVYTWHTIADFPFDSVLWVALDSFIVLIDQNNPTSIQIINVYDESIQQLDLSSYLSRIEDIQSNKGFLFVRGNSGDDPIVLQLAENFQMVKASAVDIPDMNGITTLRYFPDRVYAWGYQGLGHYKANYRICYAYQDPSPVHWVDLKLDSMWIHSIKIVSPHNPIYADLGISCKITNLSPDTIRRASLHHNLNDPYGTCFTGVEVIHLGNLNILPGATDTIQFQSYSSTLAQSNMLKRHYYLEHGNHHLDGDTSNNAFNMMYVLTSTRPLQKEVIHVYPNPFTEVLHTTGILSGVDMILYDQSGRLVSRGYDQLTDLGWLSDGFYFLRVSSDDFILMYSVVKVE